MQTEVQLKGSSEIRLILHSVTVAHEDSVKADTAREGEGGSRGPNVNHKIKTCCAWNSTILILLQTAKCAANQGHGKFLLFFRLCPVGGGTAALRCRGLLGPLEICCVKPVQFLELVMEKWEKDYPIWR